MTSSHKLNIKLFPAELYIHTPGTHACHDGTCDWSCPHGPGWFSVHAQGACPLSARQQNQTCASPSSALTAAVAIFELKKYPHILHIITDYAHTHTHTPDTHRETIVIYEQSPTYKLLFILFLLFKMRWFLSFMKVLPHYAHNQSWFISRFYAL